MSPRRCSLVVLVVTGSALAGTGPGAAPPLAAGAPAAPPCQIASSRTVAPHVLEEGSSAAVDVRFGFDCPSSQRKVNLYLLVNGPTVSTGEPSLAAINAALNTALGAFVARFDRAVGSRGGYGVFGESFGEQWPLRPMAEWPSGLGAWVTPAIDTRGLLPALEHAAAALPPDPAADGAMNLVVAVIGSSRPIGSSAEIAVACDALAAADARLVVIALESLRGSGGLHDLTCIGSFLRGTDTAGADLGYVFDQLAAETILPPSVQQIEVFDGLSETFAYVPDSASPHEPTTILGNDLTWTYDRPEQGQYRLSYRVTPAVGWTDVRRTLSREAYVRFVFASGEEASQPLANPNLCIHAYRRPAFCAALPAFLPFTLNRSAGR